MCIRDREETTATGTFTDAEIAGNGTYTLKLEGADFQGETAISQLHIATDIPLNDKIKFTNVKAKVDGREVTSFDEGVPENEEPYLPVSYTHLDVYKRQDEGCPHIWMKKVLV